MEKADVLLLELADGELERLLSSLPTNRSNRISVFLEVMRVFDYWAIYKHEMSVEQSGTAAECFVMNLGWDLAIEHLFSGLDKPGFPMTESTPRSRLNAKYLLFRFGLVAYLRNVASFVKANLAEVKRENGRIVVRLQESIKYQVMDALEYELTAELDIFVKKTSSPIVNGWEKFEFGSDFEGISEYGAFYGVNNSGVHSDKKVEDLESLMKPLIFPFDYGRGVMMGYDALPEIDAHYFSYALDYVISARDIAGLHPDVKINGVSAPHFIVIVAVVLALHCKHVGFANIARFSFPDISIPQSLTIWTTKEDLCETVEAHTGFERDLVLAALDAICYGERDLTWHKSGGHLRPLLFDLGNGMILRPLSSLLRNPFYSIIELQHKRDNKFINMLCAPREDWFRKHLYYLFMGNRYIRIPGNIKLRDKNQVLTDIDGVIYDTLSGGLAFFQLKWQDSFTHDVNKMRSKAKNLASEVDSWALAVSQWLKDKSQVDIVKSLRLKLPEGRAIGPIYCFAISWSAFRVQAFGYHRKMEFVAGCNWPLFRRARFEVGKSLDVFGDIFEYLSVEYSRLDEAIAAESLEVSLASEKVLFENNFHILSR